MLFAEGLADWLRLVLGVDAQEIDTINAEAAALLLAQTVLHHRRYLRLKLNIDK